MHKGIFLGLATADIVYYVPHHLNNNEKLKAERQIAYAGGPATNAAVAFAAFENEASLVTGLGQHPLAHVAKHDILDYKVNLIDYTDQPKRPPVLASIMVDLSNGDRAVVYSNTDLRKLRHDAVTETLLEYADLLMLDGYYLPQAIQLAHWARIMRIPVILDGGSWKEGMEKLLPLVDYAICSDNFLPPGCQQNDEVIRSLDQFGINHIAITRGGDPILAHTDGETSEVTVMPVQPVDTLGAGDIFHGAFCHYILERNDFLISLERAGEIASLSCSSLGTRAWIEQAKFA
ncbi:MAG: PfkB family carbohydrate kinase [Desulfobulbus sp.]|nr:PfkB family carbohydrate kinase [Desulfobulbus sp.]